MKKDYYVKIKKKQIRKKLRSESGRRKSPVFFVPKVIRQKFAFLKISSILKTETEKRTRKAEMQKELQRSKSSVLIHWRYAFTKFRPFFVCQDRWL